MADTSLGFRYRYRLYGGEPTIQKFVAKDTGTYYKGDLVELTSNEAEVCSTDAKNILGVVNQTTATVDSTTEVEVIVDPDAVYGVYDANARKYGAALDVSGALGSMTVTSDTNHDLIVVADSSATQETLVMVTHGAHVMTVTVT